MRLYRRDPRGQRGRRSTKSSSHLRLTLWLTLILCTLILGFCPLGYVGALPSWATVECAIGGGGHSGLAHYSVIEDTRELVH